VNRSHASVRDELAALEGRGLRRTLRVVELAAGSRARVAGRDVLVLCSNDYLALSTDPRLAEAAAAAARAEGVGAGAARLVTGTRPSHAALEHAVASFTGAAAALTFSSGYAGNLAVLASLLGPEDLAVSDALNHASLVDGLRLSGTTKRVVPHRDVAAVRDALRDRDRFRRVAIVTEGLFSMDGDVAPLADLAEIAAAHGAFLVVDDAHGTGVLGAHGHGALEGHGVSASDTLVRLGTFGKAFGAAGAFVAASQDVCDLVLHRGRGFVFTTAPAPPVVAAAAAGLAIAAAEPERRAACLARAAQLRGALRDRGVACVGGAANDTRDGPIVSLVLGDPAKAVEASRRLVDEHAILVTAIRPPTVPEGTSRLRVTTNAALSEADVDRAAAALARVLA